VWCGGQKSEGAPVLSDLDARVVVVEHRDGSARFGVDHLVAVMSVRGRRIVVADPGQRTDDLVSAAMIDVLMSMFPRLRGQYSARSRTIRAPAAANNGPGRAR
jgi:putative resolvase